MDEFKVGDWVYADDWCYGQISEIENGTAYVEYDTDRGGGTCGFELEELRKAEPPKKMEFIPKPSYAVVVTFSFDSQVSVLLFEDWAQALEFIKADILDEYRIDTQENGWDSEYAIFEEEGRAVLTTHFADRDDVVEWRIGTIYERE